MSEDFETGLHDLYTRAAAAHSGSSGFPTTAMVATARRNRRVRAASVTLTTAAVVVGFGVAAVAMIGGRPQTTPATEPPEPPAVVGTRANPACRMAVADLRVFAEPPASIDIALDARSVPSTGYLTGALKVVALDPGWGTEIRPSVWGGVEYAAVQGGQIVALPSFEGTATENAAFPLMPCADADEDGDLEPGQYDLWAFNAATIDGDDAYLIGGPWPFTITDAATPDGQTPETMPLLPPENHYVESSGVSAIPLSEDSLEDGDYFGYLSGIDATAGTVQVDIAIFYTGQAAIDYLTANDPTAENPPPGGFWIVNDVERIRTLTLSPDVRIYLWCYGNDLGFAERTLTEWAAAPATGEHSCDAGAALSRGWGDETYWFDVRDGVVLQVVGQFLP